jgi:hypothetical protein
MVEEFDSPIANKLVYGCGRRSHLDSALLSGMVVAMGKTSTRYRNGMPTERLKTGAYKSKELATRPARRVFRPTAPRAVHDRSLRLTRMSCHPDQWIYAKVLVRSGETVTVESWAQGQGG